MDLFLLIIIPFIIGLVAGLPIAYNLMSRKHFNQGYEAGHVAGYEARLRGEAQTQSIIRRRRELKKPFAIFGARV